MIELKVKTKCSRCDICEYFDPKIEKVHKSVNERMESIVITCEHEEHCKRRTTNEC